MQRAPRRRRGPRAPLPRCAASLGARGLGDRSLPTRGYRRGRHRTGRVARACCTLTEEPISTTVLVRCWGGVTSCSRSDWIHQWTHAQWSSVAHGSICRDRPAASMPLRPGPRPCTPPFPADRLAVPLLLPRLPRLRPLSRPARRSRRGWRHRHFSNGARSGTPRRWDRGSPLCSPLGSGRAPLVHRLLPEPGREHRRLAALPAGSRDSLVHGPPKPRAFARRGARQAALQAVRAFRCRPLAAGSATTSDRSSVRAPSCLVARLVDAGARAPIAFLRRAYRPFTRRASGAHQRKTLVRSLGPLPQRAWVMGPDPTVRNGHAPPSTGRRGRPRKNKSSSRAAIETRRRFATRRRIL